MAGDGNLAGAEERRVSRRLATAAREPSAPASGAKGLKASERSLGLKVMCAWHPQFFGEELVMREGAPGAAVSHGICERCLDRAFPTR